MIEQPQQYEQKVSFYYEAPKDRPPTEEQVNEAFDKAVADLVSAVESGRSSPYPPVCYFIEKGDALEILWPNMLFMQDPKTGVWRYAGTYKRELELELREYKEKLSELFKQHSEWFNNSVNQIISQYLKHENRLKSYLAEKYKVGISAEDFSKWVMQEYGKNLHASISFQAAPDREIIWITKWNWTFPDLRKTFEPSIFEEDLHRYCREIIDDQKKIAERLDKEAVSELKLTQAPLAECSREDSIGSIGICYTKNVRFSLEEICNDCPIREQVSKRLSLWEKTFTDRKNTFPVESQKSNLVEFLSELFEEQERFDSKKLNALEWAVVNNSTVAMENTYAVIVWQEGINLGRRFLKELENSTLNFDKGDNSFTGDKQKLEKFIFKFQVAAFLKVQQRLKEAGYFSDTGTWVKDAKALAELLAIFQAKGYFKTDKKQPDLRKYFEERYGVSIPRDYVKPSYQQKHFFPKFQRNQSEFTHFFE